MFTTHPILIRGLSLTAALIVSTASLVAVAGPARAEGDRTTTVSYAGIDLASDAGRAVMQKRLAAATRKVCIRASDGDDVTTQRQVAACRAQAMANASAMLAATRTADAPRLPRG